MENPREQFEKGMDSLVRAGWLKAHIFTEGKGHHLVWTLVGGGNAMFLKELAVRNCLLDDDRAPLVFDILCQGGSLPVGIEFHGEMDPEVAALWNGLIDEVGIHGMEDELRVLIHIVDGWAPDADTGFRFGDS